jgi:hypothetical protein
MSQCCMLLSDKLDKMTGRNERCWSVDLAVEYINCDTSSEDTPSPRTPPGDPPSPDVVSPPSYDPAASRSNPSEHSTATQSLLRNQPRTPPPQPRSSWALATTTRQSAPSATSSSAHEAPPLDTSVPRQWTLATGPPRPPSRGYQHYDNPIEEEEWELRMQRMERRAREVERDRYLKGLLQEAYRTGCFKAFWRAMRNEE